MMRLFSTQATQSALDNSELLNWNFRIIGSDALAPAILTCNPMEEIARQFKAITNYIG